tara:strand:+ start:33973 stop:35274 length:1302 start_codon:yes stop_codon:yes gene_type:complete
MLQAFDWKNLDEQARTKVLARPDVSQDVSIRDQARRIIESVRAGGDRALRQLTAQHDKAKIDGLRVTDEEIASAERILSNAQKRAIDSAITNVRRFHERQLPDTLSVETVPGVHCERISHALDAVGLYVPAGSAPLPSAAIMLGVPASIAACPRIALCTPPRPDGSADPAILVAATRAGAREIYKVGGAQAIAALAYGTESIAPVRKIFGPGNAWVTAAKSLVSSDPDGAAIDMPAGPSEVLVIADSNASPRFVAADLLSQAEHGVDSQVILLTSDAALGDKVLQEIETQMGTLSREKIALQALQHARVIIVNDLQDAVAISNRYAPEHLILQTEAPRSLLPQIRNAGSVFLGPWSPESVGDYCSGTNHVLPTYGYAATYSGLGVEHFMRHMTVQEVTQSGLRALAPTLATLTDMEGLDAHAAAVRYRLEAMS